MSSTQGNSCTSVNGAILGAVPCAQGMAALEQLVRTVVDILRHRVEANLSAVAATRLLDLPSQHAVSHEEFVTSQAAFVKKQAAALAIRWGTSLSEMLF